MRRANHVDKGEQDDRLPLRWAVILAVSAWAACGAALLGGGAIGVGVGVAALGLLSKVVGH